MTSMHLVSNHLSMAKGDKGEPSKRLPLFAVVVTLYWFSMYTYVPTLPTYVQALGASYQLVGLIVGSYGFTQMLVRIPLGILSDKLGTRKWFVCLGITVALISALGFFLFPSRTAALIFRALAGVAAASWVSFTVLFSSYFRREEAPKAIGLINALCSLGMLLGIFAGGLVSRCWGSLAPFLLSILAAGAATVLSPWIFEHKAEERIPATVPELVGVVKQKRFLHISLLAVLSQFITCATVYGFTPVMAKQLGATDFQLGLLTTVTTLPGIFASILSGTYLAKRIGERRVILYGFLLTGAMCGVIPMVHSLPLLYFTQIVGGLGLGGAFPMLMGLSIKDIAQNRRSAAMGFFQAIYGLGMFLGPLLIGILTNRVGLAWGFWTVALVGLAGALLASALPVTNTI